MQILWTYWTNYYINIKWYSLPKHGIQEVSGTIPLISTKKTCNRKISGLFRLKSAVFVHSVWSFPRAAEHLHPAELLVPELVPEWPCHIMDALSCYPTWLSFCFAASSPWSWPIWIFSISHCRPSAGAPSVSPRWQCWEQSCCQISNHTWIQSAMRRRKKAKRKSWKKWKNWACRHRWLWKGRLYQHLPKLRWCPRCDLNSLDNFWLWNIMYLYLIQV